MELKQALNVQCPTFNIELQTESSMLPSMKAFHILSFLSGAAVALAFTTLRASNSSPDHVYELRMYHVHEGKMDALKARFGNHTNAIFKRHNMKSIGY